MPSDESVEIFDKQYQSSGVDAQRRYPNETLIQFLAKNYFGIKRNDRKTCRILEIGSGSGANLWMIAKEGFDVYGVDGSYLALSLASSYLKDVWQVNVKQATAYFNQLPFNGEFMEAVVDVVSLQHQTLAQSHEALSEVYRVLNPGGKFFSFRLSDRSIMFSDGGDNWIDPVTLANIDNQEMPLADNGPISFWSPEIVNKEYDRVGLQVESVERVGRTYKNQNLYVEYLAIEANKPEN